MGHFLDLKKKDKDKQWKVDFKKYDTKIKLASQMQLALGDTEEFVSDIDGDAGKDDAGTKGPAVIPSNASEEEEVLMTGLMEEELKVQSADDYDGDGGDKRANDENTNDENRDDGDDNAKETEPLVEEETKDNDGNVNQDDANMVVHSE